MHEWPLVVFTALAIPSAGVFAARLLTELLPVPAMPAEGLPNAATLVLLVALAVSLAHLGHVARAPLAIVRAGRNPLSTEVALSTALLAVSTASYLPTLHPAVVLALQRATGILALGLLAAIGLVYFLPARRPWRGALVATPIASGLAAGAIVLAWRSPSPAATTLALVLVLLDAAVAAPAWAIHRMRDGFAAVHPAIFERRALLKAARFALVDLLPAIFLVLSPGLAAGCILAGLWVDRLAFYGLATARTPEAEAARVEKAIEGLAR